jgi:hypothetical protein
VLHNGEVGPPRLDVGNQRATETAARTAGSHIAMEPHDWPLDAVSTAMLVARAVADIDASGEEEQCALLSELLCAAWGSLWAQNQ